MILHKLFACKASGPEDSDFQESQFSSRVSENGQGAGRGGGVGDKNVTDRPQTKTIDAGDHTDVRKCHGVIYRSHIT